MDWPRLSQRLLGAWTAVVFVFLYLPIVLVTVFSFNDSRLSLPWEGFTFDWYRRLLTDTVLLRAVKNSFIIAVATTAISVPLGTVGAWMLHRYRFPLRRVVAAGIFVALAMPEILLGISLLILFAAVFRRLEAWQQLPWMPSWFAEADFGLGYLTVIISHVTFCVPFVLLAVQARLAGLDPAWEEAAMDLGASPLRTFWSVILPYLRPAVIAGGLMAFTLSMDEVIVTVFTTGADSRTLPLVMFDRVKKGLDPSLNAVSTVTIILTVALVILSEWLRRATRKRSHP